MVANLCRLHMIVIDFLYISLLYFVLILLVLNTIINTIWEYKTIDHSVPYTIASFCGKQWFPTICFALRNSILKAGLTLFRKQVDCMPGCLCKWHHLSGITYSAKIFKWLGLGHTMGATLWVYLDELRLHGPLGC